MEPLISVIVPVYRIERYIGICIESILDQTYKNLEIILVDDGSPDRCPEICDLYASKDSRIVVIHKENGGLVSARKAGILASHGEYIGVVDGDDRIGRGYYMSLFSAISESGADAAVAGFTRDLFSKSQVILNALPSGTYEGEALSGLYKQMLSCGKFHSYGITTYLWNKLFRREYIFECQLNVDDGMSAGGLHAEAVQNLPHRSRFTPTAVSLPFQPVQQLPLRISPYAAAGRLDARHLYHKIGRRVRL